MAFPQLLRMRKFVGIPPKSTNNLYRQNKGFWYKTHSYKLFRTAFKKLLKDDGFLPSSEADWRGHGLYLEAGIIKEFDLDNTLKGIIDALQENYGFNDNQINGIICRKKVVGTYPLSRSEWNKQYIKIGFLKYSNNDCEVFSDHEISSMPQPSEEIPVPWQLTEILYRSVTEDWNDLGNKLNAVYRFNLFPDTYNAAQISDIPEENIIGALTESGTVYHGERKAAEQLGINTEEEKDRFVDSLKNEIDTKIANEHIRALNNIELTKIG